MSENEEKKDLAIPETGGLPDTYGHKEGLEDMDYSDLIIPRMILLQSNSPQVQDDDSTFKKGMSINNLTQTILAKAGEAFKVQFLGFAKTRILWFPKSEGGGTRCKSNDSKVASSGEFLGTTCAKCPYSQWSEGKNAKPPECVIYFNFPLLHHIEPDPVLGPSDPEVMWVSFGKTNFAMGKKLLNAINFGSKAIYERWIILKSNEISNNFGKFFVYEGRLGEKIADEHILSLGRMYSKMLKDMKVSYENESEPGEETNSEIA